MLMPAYRAAEGLSPTARNSNPRVERNRSHETNAAATRARANAQLTRNPSMIGGITEPGSTIGETGSLRPGRW